jgi:hypothetical protein
MESKSITLASSINFETREEYEKYRKREEVRAFVEEFRRIKAQRVVPEVTVGTYYGTPRSSMPFSWGEDFICGTEDNGQETTEDSTFRP